MSKPQSLALAAAAQASDALAELIRFAKEGPSHPTAFGHVEVIEQLLDAAKMALEIEGGSDSERVFIHGAICRYLEGWA